MAVGFLVLAACAAGVAGRERDRAARARGRVLGRPNPGAPRWFADLLWRGELPVDPERWWPWVRRVGVGTGLVALVAAPALGVVAVAGWAGVRLVGPRLARARDRTACDAALPGAIDALVASMASGASLAQAIVAAADRPDVVGGDLAVVAAHHRQGTGVQAAVDRWAGTRPGTGVELLADALALAGSSGGSQVHALMGVGDTLREREALAREVSALGSQAQMSAMVLVAAPPAFVAVVSLVDRQVARFLFATPAGWACVALGVVLDLAGGLWMRLLVRGIR